MLLDQKRSSLGMHARESSSRVARNMMLIRFLKFTFENFHCSFSVCLQNLLSYMRCRVKQDPHPALPTRLLYFNVNFFSSCDKTVPKKSPLPKSAATQACPGKKKCAKESSSSEESSDSSDGEKPPAKQKPKSGKY